MLSIEANALNLEEERYKFLLLLCITLSLYLRDNIIWWGLERCATYTDLWIQIREPDPVFEKARIQLPCFRSIRDRIKNTIINVKLIHTKLRNHYNLKITQFQFFLSTMRRRKNVGCNCQVIPDQFYLLRAWFGTQVNLSPDPKLKLHSQRNRPFYSEPNQVIFVSSLFDQIPIPSFHTSQA